MELSDFHLEAIKKAAASVEYGFVTINISATSNVLDLTVQNRIRLPQEITETKRKPRLLEPLRQSLK